MFDHSSLSNAQSLICDGSYRDHTKLRGRERLTESLLLSSTRHDEAHESRIVEIQDLTITWICMLSPQTKSHPHWKLNMPVSETALQVIFYEYNSGSFPLSSPPTTLLTPNPKANQRDLLKDTEQQTTLRENAKKPYQYKSPSNKTCKLCTTCGYYKYSYVALLCNY